MKKNRLQSMLFMVLCCDLGIVAKKIISPISNSITGMLKIPGGISAGFSLMFIVVATTILSKFGVATVMGGIQSIVALFLGSVGSMGALAPISYILPCIVIDVTILVSNKLNIKKEAYIMVANTLGSLTSCVFANTVIFKLHGYILLIYLSASIVSGLTFGYLAVLLVKRLKRLSY